MRAKFSIDPSGGLIRGGGVPFPFAVNDFRAGIRRKGAQAPFGMAFGLATRVTHI